MLALAIKTMRSNKIRFALTASTVMVGVAFVVAAFVTADSLRSIFGDLAVDVSEGIDYRVRGKLPFGDFTETVTPPVSADLIDEILAVDGVGVAEGTFFVDNVIPVDGKKTPVSTTGAPVAGTNWTNDESLSQFYLIDGEWPVESSQFAIDVGTFANYDFELGQDYQIVTPTGPHTFTLTGTAQFGYPDNAGVGATFSVFNKATAQEVLGYPNQFSGIAIRAEPGANLKAVQDRIEAVLPNDTELITASEITEEFSSAFESIIIIFQTILLVFAFVVLFVSTFIVSNTFNIVLNQRVRELALLRAIGATPRQVLRSVLMESLVVGTGAVVIGIGLGMLGAMGIRGLFSLLGASLPEGPLPLLPRTVIIAMILGIGITVIASLLPAIKASRTSPIAGLSVDDSNESSTYYRHRTARKVVGGSFAVIGFGLVALGLFASLGNVTLQLSSLGAGAAAVFVAIAVLSPLVARPIVSVIAQPLDGVFGTTGQLARKNAARNPRRTSATAVALTVSLALMSSVSVIGESFKDSFSKQLNTAIKADFIATVSSERGLPKTLAEDMSAAGVGTVVAFSGALVQMYTDPSQVPNAASDPTATAERTDVLETSATVIDVSNIDVVANLEVIEGSLKDIDPKTGLLIHTDTAEEYNLNLGSEVVLVFITGEPLTVKVAAIYEQNSALWGDLLIDRQLHRRIGTSVFEFDDVVTVKVTDTDIESARDVLNEVIASYPNTNLEDRQEFLATVESNRNIALTLVNVFLGFALLIALVGIVNTLTLSVSERTREIGLLRAVGMTRRQLRRMIRWEAAAVTFYGALIGIATGMIFGVATVTAIPEDIIGEMSVPVFQLLTFSVVATVFGIIAAALPSYRAGRMNVLQAISGN